MNNYRYKQVYIPTNEVWEKDFTYESHPFQYDPYMSRANFLELINNWNQVSLLQSSVNDTKKVNWIYIAL